MDKNKKNQKKKNNNWAKTNTISIINNTKINVI